MGKDTSPYVVGDYWLDKRRDGRSDTWQIATYSAKSRSVVYRSTKRRELEDAKGVIHAFVDRQRAKGPQSVEAAPVLPQLLLYWDEHGSKVRKPDVIAGSLRAFIGFLMQDEVGPAVTVAQLTPNVINRFIAWRMGPHSYDVPWRGKDYRHQSEGIKGESVQRNIEDVRAALNHAARNQRIPYVPRIPPVPENMRSKPRDVVLSIDQMGAVLAFMSMDKTAWRWVSLMLGTAARPNACLAFDPANQWRGDLIDMHPKDWPLTKKRNPSIPLIEPLRPILKEWLADPHEIVRSRRTAWRTMRDAIGLPDNIVPKTIRHTLATLLRTRGVPQEQISTLLGHSYGNRTTGVYAKYDPDYLRTAMAALTTIYSEVVAASDRWHADHLRTTCGNRRGIVVDRNAANG
jgi:integrase